MIPPTEKSKAGFSFGILGAGPCAVTMAGHPLVDLPFM